MKTNISDKFIAYLALISGLSISAVAIYYSVAGLMAIFAAAVIPIMIMGVVLEIGKLSATVWLKQNWHRAPGFLKAYLLVAILVLMMLTSMGIFGYLSKAHLDQAVPTGDVASKVELIEEKIKTQRDNVTAARAAIQQMDNQVNERLSRSTDDKGAERAVQIRRQQQAERNRLQQDIARAQAEIAKLNEEKAPIAKELRKVEAEVGPIKYIAALVYGDNPDANLLERAVRWVIIVIVLVFDPLAVILLLASQYSFQWFRKEEDSQEQETPANIIPAEEMASDIYELEKLKDPEPENTGYVHSPWPFPVQSEPHKEEVKEEDFKFLADDKDLYPEGKPWEEAKEESVNEEQIAVVEEITTDTLPVAEERHNEIEDLVEEGESNDDEIFDAAAETEKKAMKAWKHDNPDSSLKHYKRLYRQGKIDKLPWEEYLQIRPDFVDEDAEAAIEAAKWAQEQIDKKNSYVQNEEQNESTIWQRVKKSKEDNV